MDLNDRTQQAVRDAGKAMGLTLSSDQHKALTKVMEGLAVDVMRACAATCGHAARACCSEDEDMAHKIAREMERAQQALVANLSSLR
jgi:histone H3/H4